MVEEELALLIYKEIVFARQLETLKMKLYSNKAFDIQAAFNSIDDWAYGYIDHKNLKNFMRKHGYVSSEQDIIAVIRRIDLDGDARISE